MNLDIFKGRARMIFALIGGIVFLALQAIFPDMPVSEEQTIVFMGLIAAYILGEGISGKTIGDNFASMLKSQKFLALVAGIIAALGKSFFPNLAYSDAELTALVASLMTFIVGAGLNGKTPIETNINIGE